MSIIITIWKKVWIAAENCRVGLVRRLIDPGTKVKWGYGKLSNASRRISKFEKPAGRNLRT